MTAFWCDHAWLGGAGLTNNVLVTINGGVLTDVQVRRTAPRGAERVRGIVLPGLANAHSHAFHRALRGRTHAGTGSFWTWRDQMYDVAARLDPSLYLALATATFAEMVLCGYTAVGEFHYLHHGPGGALYGNRNEMGHVLMEAANLAGIRLTLLDTCYLRGGFDVELNAVQRRYSDGSVDGWIERNEEFSKPTDPRTMKFGAAIHSVRALSELEMSEVAAWTQGRGFPLHAHVSEQVAENEACLRHTGRTPTQLLAHAGALSDRFCAVHATHLSSADMNLLGAAGATICICGTTERDLADGICESTGLVRAGARLAIGSDSHAVIDPFEETRAIETHQRLRTHTRGNHRSDELLSAASLNGYRSLGWMGGQLRVGSVADLVVIDPDSARLAGADRADIASLVFGATASDVRDVMVDGRWVVRDRTHMSCDVPRVLSTSIEAIWSTR